MIGTRLAHYEITAHLGSGGMGDVYQATDLKLGRSVAIKLLPDAFASDADRLLRFRREAQVLASLNHPNIAHIYGIEESGEKRCIVMELVEGKTLQARIKRGPLPVDEALTIAKQIAEALEAAHEKGVIHRDLKPGNVMLTEDGKVKVLDFGLAKAYDANPSNASLSNSPTMVSMAATNAGVILGTAAYMSPEQAKGRAVDKRTDIFAFGCVLYEMLTGRPVFEGADTADILGSVLKSEPDWTLLPAATQSTVRNLLRLCLEKNVKNRRGGATDVRLDIELALKELGSVTRPTGALRNNSRLAWIVAAVLALALVSITVVYLRTPAVELREIRLQFVTPPTDDPFAFALSPDGRQMLFEAVSEGKHQLWLRLLDSETVRPLPGTENPDYSVTPFWSPDSRAIGFFAGGKLRKMDLASGGVQVLADTPQARGGTWNRDGIILFAPSSDGALYRIPATGGEPVEVTKVDRPQQTNHRYPQFLSDGSHFIFWAGGTPEVRGVYIGSLDSKESQRLLEADGAAVVALPDHLLFVRQQTLFTQRIDRSRNELTGVSVPVAEHVDMNDSTFAAAISASETGILAYRNPSTGVSQLTWFDRSGKQTGVLGEPDPSFPRSPEISPDGGLVALERTVGGNDDVWIIDSARGFLRPFTTAPSSERTPIWSRDGRRIAFASNRKGIFNLYVKATSGTEDEELLLESLDHKDALDWTPDGGQLLYASFGSKTKSNILALPFGGDRKPIPIAQSTFDEEDGRLSPDGHWIAYSSDESGRKEIYVQPFPSPGSKSPISTNGGAVPRWRGDGKEIIYLSPDNKFTAVSVTLRENGQVDAGKPQTLFAEKTRSDYTISSDGQRFLVVVPTGEPSTPPISVIVNWKPK